MAGRELELPKSSASTLREQLARKTFENVRRRGHSYVEFREDNKRTVFFCVLCLATCYSDSVLYDPLRGHLYKIRYDAAKATLLKPNMWPFNDGVYFFHDLSDHFEKSKDSNANGFNFLEIDEIEVNNNLAIVPHNGKKNPGCFRLESLDRPESEVVYSDGDKDSSGDCNGNGTEDLVITGVLHKNEICSLHVRFIGVSKLAARFCKKEGITKDISRLWCEWLGKNDLENEDILIPNSDFAVVTFPYDYDLGRKALFTDVKHFLLPSSHQVNGRATKRKRKSFSDPEDISESLGSSQYDSSGECVGG
ncbi:C2H2-type domain-containing protein [Heracleum sosnowskyi]|uniref:C2H2-type domain-containing protein n=1 Tax=Heracleum sosnowskyi TaxID=360622 RepID=A0AAD8I5T5_9APIA|nr:C2H2-type domain-containing protein [Heracleum sosnowskyi]